MTETEKMKMQSEDIGELADALAKAQSEIKTAAKAKENPFFKSKYADLPAIWDCCRAALTKNGVAVVQSPEVVEGQFLLVTTLAHKSGQWMRSTYPILPVKQDPQGVGSAITYARRYALSAMVGVVADEDDDGNAASDGGSAEKITPQQRAELQALLTSAGKNIEAFCNYFKIGALPDLPAARFQEAVNAINAKPRAPKAA